MRLPVEVCVLIRTLSLSSMLILMSVSRCNISYTDTVSCTVKNVGDCDGAEVVQLYVADKTGHAYRPIRELKAFKKVFLKDN